MTPSSVQFSSTYMSGLDRSLGALQLRDAVIEKASPELCHLLNSPNDKAWWPGELGIELVCGIVRQHGDDGMRRVSVHTSHQRIGPIVKPLINVLLIVGGSTFHSMGTRAHHFVSVGIRGIVSTYEPLSPSTARLTFSWPHDVPREMALIWSGLFDVGFTLLKKGRIAEQTIKPAEHAYALEW